MPRPSLDASWVPTTPPLGAPLEMARILLVDDEELVCRSLQRLLRNQTRFEIRTAFHGREAERVFEREGPFDLLLTDLTLQSPRDGAELARRLVARKPDLRVVFMSGDVPLGFVSPYAMLQKPFDRDGLVSALDAALDAPHREIF